ncbi:MAG: hypothetical protein QNK05_04085 [Myxococcota bacterium]|nr:hypothetical protein [Myxococcota bacterium]
MKRPTAAGLRRGLPPALNGLLDRVLGEAESGGIGVLAVGGPVRDFLLGRGVRDLDLVVEPAKGRDAISLARAAAPKGARVVAHQRFGTVKIETAEATLDLATLRSETYSSPGALPRVQPGSLREDLERRDFSVNALAMPLTEAARADRPTLIDPGRGREDLEARRLRVFHERSFHDDPTRALRAARLAPRLGFHLVRGSRAALRDALRDGAFAAVSAERYRAEIERVFLDRPLGLESVAAIQLLADWHVLAALEPGLTLPAVAAPRLRRLGKLAGSGPFETAEAWQAGMRVWLQPLESGLRRRALSRLAVRGEDAERIHRFPREASRWLRSLGRARGRGAVAATLLACSEEDLLALAAVADPGVRRKILRFASEDRGVTLPVTGRDLVAAGLSGPAVGRALEQIRIAVLDRAVRDRDEALALAAEVGRRSRPRRRAKERL